MIDQTADILVNMHLDYHHVLQYWWKRALKAEAELKHLKEEQSSRASSG